MIQNRSESEFDQEAGSSVDLRQIYHVFLERIWAVLLVLTLTTFLGGLYVVRSPKIYSATLTLQVEQESKIVDLTKFKPDEQTTTEILKTFEQTIVSRPVLERVAATNQLTKNGEFLTIYERKKGLFDAVAGTAAPEKEISIDGIAGTLAAITESRMRRGTRLIDVSVEHPNAAMAALLANSIFKQYVQLSYEQYVSSGLTASQFLVEEAEKLKKKMLSSEKALQTYREKVGSAAISLDDKKDIVGQKLKEMSKKVTEAKSVRISLESDLAQIQQLGTNIGALLGIASVANDPTVRDIKSNLSKFESEFATIKQRYLPKHPKYMGTLSALTEWRNALTNAVMKIPQTIEISYRGAKSSEETFEAALKEQEALELVLNKQKLEFDTLSREVESDRGLYENVMKKMKESQISKELQSDKLRVIQPAIAPERPSKPQKVKIMAAAVLVGLMGGLMLALLLNQIDSSIKSVDQAEEFLQLPVLSAIPQITAFGNNRGLVVVDDAKSIGAEAIRTLRTSLSMLGKAENRRVYLFTSAIPAEGKTFCSLNYAVSLAQQGSKTLLIDGDLRRPAVEKAISGKDKKAVGVTDYILGQKTLKEIVQQTGIENFSFIPAGTTAPNPAELLGQHGIDGLVAEALLNYDRVVIDSAPVHAVSDTLLMLKRVQTVCLVARANKTPRKATLRAVQMLRQAEAPLAGLILNRLPRRVGLGGYYYDSYYNYSYYGKYGAKGVYGAKA
ncbi:chain-length determining protein [Verrucomicrobiota bacterium]|nr:chain-length determining protein [Verrucomicrobiota bacterium]